MIPRGAFFKLTLETTSLIVLGEEGLAPTIPLVALSVGDAVRTILVAAALISQSQKHA